MPRTTGLAELEYLPQAHADAAAAMRELLAVCDAKASPSRAAIEAADRAYMAVGMLLGTLRRARRAA